MDLDAYVNAHRGEWQRLEQLLSAANRPKALSGLEVDELVDLYQRTATHLSVVQSAGRDPQLVASLSTLVARARGTIAGRTQSSLSDVVRFLRSDFPALCYRTRYWWFGTTAVFLVIALAFGFWIANDPGAYAAVGSQDDINRLVNEDFESYYSSAPAQDFAARVFTNNALIAAASIVSGVLLGLPIPYLLFQNAANVGISGGLLAANGKSGLFFGLILPHGMLELTAVLVASGLALKLGWTVVDPGRRRRVDALAEEGRALVAGGLGLVLVLFVTGIIEGFVTPSGLPTAVRIGIGVVAELGFLYWVLVIGKRAHLAGVSGDLDARRAGDVLPTA